MLNGEPRIRVSNDGDVVLARRGVDPNVGHTGMTVQDLNRRRVDSLRSQGAQRQVPKDVIAHRADHVRLGTGAGRRERLIGPLAAQRQTEVVSDHRLARSGEWRSVGREVGVDAADYGYTTAHHTGELSERSLAKVLANDTSCGGKRSIGQHFSRAGSRERMSECCSR